MPRGTRPQGQVCLVWSAQFAYAIGLLTADGCLSKDGRHIDFTSKDEELVVVFRKCLGLNTKVSKKLSGAGNASFHTQFGDVLFYRFLLNIGLTPAKSKTLSQLSIPSAYFFDFLRGVFDGDGCSYAYVDPVYKNSYRFYISFASASPRFLVWIQQSVHEQAGINGYINTPSKRPSQIQLKYAKRESLVLYNHLYYSPKVPKLERKYLKILNSVNIINQSRSGETGRRAAFRAQ
jgi:hypothetical protein